MRRSFQGLGAPSLKRFRKLISDGEVAARHAMADLTMCDEPRGQSAEEAGLADFSPACNCPRIKENLTAAFVERARAFEHLDAMKTDEKPIPPMNVVRLYRELNAAVERADAAYDRRCFSGGKYRSERAGEGEMETYEPRPFEVGPIEIEGSQRRRRRKKARR